MLERRSPPFTHNVTKAINATLSGMETLHQKLAKENFTAAELLDLFVDPAHHHTLTHAYQICEPSGQTQELFVRCEVPVEYGAGVVHMRFSWHGLDTPDGFYVPYRAGSTLMYACEIRYEDALADNIAKFERVRDDLIGIAYRHACVRRVFTALNRNAVCSTPAQMRYHWPCIVSLLRRSGNEEMAERLQNPSPRAGDGARIPKDLGPLLSATNDTVARHAFLVDIPTPPVPSIPYELRENFKRS